MIFFNRKLRVNVIQCNPFMFPRCLMVFQNVKLLPPPTVCDCWPIIYVPHTLLTCWILTPHTSYHKLHKRISNSKKDEKKKLTSRDQPERRRISVDATQGLTASSAVSPGHGLHVYTDLRHRHIIMDILVRTIIIIIIMSVFLEHLCMWNMLSCPEQVQIQKYKTHAYNTFERNGFWMLWS